MAHFIGAFHILDQERRSDDPITVIEQLSRWLLSIRPEEARLLHTTREFRDFMLSAYSLERAHRHIRTWHDPHHTCDISEGADARVVVDVGHLVGRENLSFLQFLAVDDVLLRVFGFLECSSLIHISCTCSRFWELGHRSARERTRDLVHERQLSNVMQLLRAQEQIEGLCTTSAGCPSLIDNVHVRVPALLLSRRVSISNAGDSEYNGIYHCTGSNGNGFVFTKPRFPHQKAHKRRRNSLSSTSSSSFPEESLGEDCVPQSTGQLLRCIIAKRFSNETILWYLSKEVVASEEDEGDDVRAGDTIQIFSFWAKLMVIGDASPDICRYPSQTSILGRNNRNEGWQTLERTQFVEPPIVELLD